MPLRQWSIAPRFIVSNSLFFGVEAARFPEFTSVGILVDQ